MASRTVRSFKEFSFIRSDPHSNGSLALVPEGRVTKVVRKSDRGQDGRNRAAYVRVTPIRVALNGLPDNLFTLLFTQMTVDEMSAD